VRARTRPGRLAAFDRWLALSESALLASPGVLVDLGFGISAVTTHELASAFPAHHVIGLERDGSRVEQARREFPTLDLRTGGLEQILGLGHVRVVRIANVGRGLTVADVQTLLHAAMGVVGPGGVVLEGSTDVEGHVTAFHVWREGRREALVLHTDGERGFSPWLFRDVLPRELRRDVKPGTAVHTFLTAWEAVWQATRTADPRDSFQRSVEALAQARRDVDPTHGGEGFASWRLSGASQARG
jgi:hypothetical protein